MSEPEKKVFEPASAEEEAEAEAEAEAAGAGAGADATFPVGSARVLKKGVLGKVNWSHLRPMTMSNSQTGGNLDHRERNGGHTTTSNLSSTPPKMA